MRTIFIAEPERYSKKGLEIYESLGKVFLGFVDKKDFLEKLREAEIVVLRLGKLTRSDIESALNLKIIAVPTTGLDHIDLDTAKERSIQVVSLRGERELLDKIYATSEHAVALLLSLLRRVNAANKHVLHGGWNRDLFIGNEISGKNVLIVGCGRLGSRMVKILDAFGAHVTVYDPHVAPEKTPSCAQIAASLTEALRSADIVSVHVTLNEETMGLFGEKEFDALKQGAFFVNTSRGAVVDEQALLVALQSEKVRAAALDVLQNESGSGKHLQNNPLVVYAAHHDNLIITPHIGGATHESMEATEVFIAEKVRASLTKNS